MQIKRYENEPEFAYIYRVCNAKGSDGLEDWDSVAHLLNNELGYTYSSSRYRKIVQCYNMVKEDLKDETLSEQIEELNRIKDEIRKERVKLQTVNIERNRIDRQDARYELFYEQIGQYIQKAISPQLKCVHTDKGNEKKYLLTIADVHDGAEFVSSNNEYSPKIVEDRFEILLEETVKFIKNRGLTELTVLGLGDWVQGVLRANDLRVNDTAVVKSCVHISQLLIDFLNQLSVYVTIDYYSVIYSNHSQIRYLGTQANAMMDEDLGYIIDNYVKTGLANNDRVKVHLPKENDMFIELNNIYGYNIIACHGHQIKNFNSAIADLSMQRHKFYSYLIAGHLHGGKELVVNEAYGNNVEVIISQSFIGSDTFSDSLFTGSKAACGIYGFDKEHGHTETYKIILN